MSEAFAGTVPCGRCGIALPPGEGERTRCVCGAELRVFRFAPRPRPSRAPIALGLPGQETPCAYHAGNAAGEACARCGSFICALCALRLRGRSYCPPCFERLRLSGGLDALKSRFPRPHAQALALGLLSAVVPCFSPLFAPLAIWLCARALGRLGELSERERWVGTKAVLGLLLGLLGLAGLVLLILSFVKERGE